MFEKLDKITMCNSPKPQRQRYHQATKKPVFGETKDSICKVYFRALEILFDEEKVVMDMGTEKG